MTRGTGLVCSHQEPGSPCGVSSESKREFHVQVSSGHTGREVVTAALGGPAGHMRTQAPAECSEEIQGALRRGETRPDQLHDQ